MTSVIVQYIDLPLVYRLLQKDMTVLVILPLFYRLVPEYKQKVAGKSLPFEKYAVYKANKYVKNNHRLVLSGLVSFSILNIAFCCFFCLSATQPMMDLFTLNQQVHGLLICTC